VQGSAGGGFAFYRNCSSWRRSTVDAEMQVV